MYFAHNFIKIFWNICEDDKIIVRLNSTVDILKKSIQWFKMHSTDNFIEFFEMSRYLQADGYILFPVGILAKLLLPVFVPV